MHYLGELLAYASMVDVLIGSKEERSRPAAGGAPSHGWRDPYEPVKDADKVTFVGVAETPADLRD